MEDSEIIEKVLHHLQGYVVESSTDTEDILSDLDYDKKVTSEEVLDTYNFAKSYATSYIGYIGNPNGVITLAENPTVIDAIIVWTAGLLWKKYDIRVNNQEDESNTLGYGDSLIIQAKEMLKPFRYFDLSVY